MDIEFHYYMTYLIAARAGFPAADVIAQSAQEVDDNHIQIDVSVGTPYAYQSVISQTMNILHPKHNERIYPIFHFIPGDPNAPSAARRDGVKSAWVTTPNSPLANEMLDSALASGNLYRIGASSHAYVDTWAHQNFLGKDDSFNEMPNSHLLNRIKGAVGLMRIGHALAGHLPDIPGLIWTDSRLKLSQIDNTSRFMDAADHLFRKFAKFKQPAISDSEVDAIASGLIADLRTDIGQSSTSSIAEEPSRMNRYKLRAKSAPYGATEIPEYREARWADDAFIEQRSNLGSRIAIFLAEHAGLAGDILDFGTKRICTWKDAVLHQETDWYKFQEAIKSHLNECWMILQKRFPEIAM